MKDIEYEFWIDYIHKIGKKHSASFDTVLDLCCGTGNSLIPMKKYARELSGIDLSLEMLKQARNKGLERIVNGDVRALPFKKGFTLVYSIFDSLNYLIVEDDLVKVFKEVKRVLVDGGFFIFDMNSIEGVKYIARQKEIVEEDDEIYSVWRYKLSGDVITLYLSVFPKNEKDGDRIDEVHRERGYSIEKVKELLMKAGFRPVVEYECFTNRLARKGSKRILYVAEGWSINNLT